MEGFSHKCVSFIGNLSKGANFANERCHNFLLNWDRIIKFLLGSIQMHLIILSANNCLSYASGEHLLCSRLTQK